MKSWASSLFPLRRAACSSVFPLASFMFTFPPLSKTCFAVSVLPNWTESRSNRVGSASSSWDNSAEINDFTMWLWLTSGTSCNGVWPQWLAESTSAPPSRRSLTRAVLASSAAKCNGVVLPGPFTFVSALLPSKETASPVSFALVARESCDQPCLFFVLTSAPLLMKVRTFSARPCAEEVQKQSAVQFILSFKFKSADLIGVPPT